MSVAAYRFSNDLRYRDALDDRNTALTPAYILEPIRQAIGGIDLDPCSTPDNPTGAVKFYAPPQDGLALDWPYESIYVNPPYGKAREPWVDRCIQAEQYGTRIALLMPAHPDTRCFQRAAASADYVVFVRGRVKFGVLRPNRRQVAASHPSAIFLWNGWVQPLRHLGIVMGGHR